MKLENFLAAIAFYPKTTIVISVVFFLFTGIFVPLIVPLPVRDAEKADDEAVASSSEEEPKEGNVNEDSATKSFFKTKIFPRGLFALLVAILLPSLASAQGMKYQTYQELSLIFVVVVAVLVIITISGVAIFSHKRYSRLWRYWHPFVPKTWKPFIRRMLIYQFLKLLLLGSTWRSFLKKLRHTSLSVARGIFQTFGDVISSIAVVSMSFVLKEPKEVEIVRKAKANNK